jgi:hypothetical protein
MVAMALVVTVIKNDVGELKKRGALVTATWPSLLVVMFFFLSNSRVPRPCLGFNYSWSFTQRKI